MSASLGRRRVPGYSASTHWGTNTKSDVSERADPRGHRNLGSAVQRYHRNNRQQGAQGSRVQNGFHHVTGYASLTGGIYFREVGPVLYS